MKWFYKFVAFDHIAIGGREHALSLASETVVAVVVLRAINATTKITLSVLHI